MASALSAIFWMHAVIYETLEFSLTYEIKLRILYNPSHEIHCKKLFLFSLIVTCAVSTTLAKAGIYTSARSRKATEEL